MKKRLLELIECKRCFTDFKLHIFKKEDNEIKDGLLICPKCKQHYCIINFIPRMLPKSIYHNPYFELRYQKEIKNHIKKELDLNKKDSLKRLKEENIKFFGHEWIHFNKHGFNDRVYNEQFEKRIFHEENLVENKSGFLNLNQNYIKKIISIHQSKKRDYSHFIWLLLMLKKWKEKWINE